MATIIGFRGWAQSAWRAWREREMRVVVDDLAEERRREELYHPHNTWFWYLPPPC